MINEELSLWTKELFALTTSMLIFVYRDEALELDEKLILKQIIKILGRENIINFREISNDHKGVSWKFKLIDVLTWEKLHAMIPPNTATGKGPAIRMTFFVETKFWGTKYTNGTEFAVDAMWDRKYGIRRNEKSSRVSPMVGVNEELSTWTKTLFGINSFVIVGINKQFYDEDDLKKNVVLIYADAVKLFGNLGYNIERISEDTISDRWVLRMFMLDDKLDISDLQSYLRPQDGHRMAGIMVSIVDMNKNEPEEIDSLYLVWSTTGGFKKVI